MLEMLYSSGIRIAELLGLNLGDVDFSHGTARVMGKRMHRKVILALNRSGDMLV